MLQAASLLVLAVLLPAAEKTRSTSVPPPAYLEAKRADERGDRTKAAALVRAALASDPENPWLHYELSSISGDPWSRDDSLLLDYRALVAASPESPWRRLFLAAALASVSGPPFFGPGESRVAEARRVFDGVPADDRLEPWRSLVEANLLRLENDRAASRKVLRAASERFPDHPAVAEAARGLDGIATAPPRKGAGEKKRDEKESLDARIFETMSLPPEAAVAELEKMLPELKGSPRDELRVLDRLARVYTPLPDSDAKKLTEILWRTLELGSKDSWNRCQFVAVAAESGARLVEAAVVADEAIDDALAGGSERPAGMFAAGASTFSVAWAFAARGLLRHAQCEDVGARRDLFLATSLRPEAARYWAWRGEVEASLGRDRDALECWTEAVARAKENETQQDEWKKLLDAAARSRYLWARADDLVAAAKARNSSASIKPGGSPVPPHPLVGKKAPEFDLEILGGGKLTLASLAGKPVVLEFWATWCKPCHEEMRVIESLQRTFENRVAFVAVSTDSANDWKDKVPATVEKEKISAIVAKADDADSVRSAYRVGPIPSLFVIGRDGNVRRHMEGFSSSLSADLTKELSEALR
ncbi:MAG TPA: TlpA disulfide reductase family protein [Thermoanaerobaculia bacterium]|nr:TlpA disulfide reductase family protein [Thermoanaerobaculia bacterium]